ncbi:DUF4331 family protein [Kineococcus rhizosphaerae]|uniref:Uncharacterized protein DUF4331 n=1 Tax=Kineococcus rhizosphaerae TaxID=559628 RepID=A0A2T0R6J2_9ACTN|nr:DUF4331 family protein [Kineococcus rhizosphaerae]PRY16773.1 uncharacterized protein DUF4331 [Kineococcus rhizosphaerae]
MSHHLDSPQARQDVRLDTTDLYLFRGERGTALVLNTCHSLGRAPVPGWHPEGRYEVEVDLDGDAVEDLTHRFTFDDRAEDGAQAFELEVLSGAAATDPHAGGSVLLRARTGEASATADGVRVWAGRAADPFWIEPTVLHAVGHAVHEGTVPDLGDWTPARARNLFADQDVHSLVLEVPDELLPAVAADGRIRVWAVAWLATHAGGWHPVNRIGLPVVHPLLAQLDEDLAERLNEGTPAGDRAAHAATFTQRLTRFVAAHGTAADPAAYAERLVGRLLPDVLPYTVGTPASFDLLGWNGRTLTDDAADVVFTLAANSPIGLGLGRGSVPHAPSSTFPYVRPVPGATP